MSSGFCFWFFCKSTLASFITLYWIQRPELSSWSFLRTEIWGNHPVTAPFFSIWASISLALSSVHSDCSQKHWSSGFLHLWPQSPFYTDKDVLDLPFLPHPLFFLLPVVWDLLTASASAKQSSHGVPKAAWADFCVWCVTLPPTCVPTASAFVCSFVRGSLHLLLNVAFKAAQAAEKKKKIHIYIFNFNIQMGLGDSCRKGVIKDTQETSFYSNPFW